MRNLPAVRSYSYLLTAAPGLQTNITDVNTGPVFAIFPVHGGRGVESRLTVEGMNISNPPGGNQPPNYTADIGNSSEVTVMTAGGLGEFETAGVQMNIVPKQGGNDLSGLFAASGFSGGMQSNNYSSDLQARGAGAPNPTYHVYDVNAAVGGPILKDKLWFFGAVNYLRNASLPPRRASLQEESKSRYADAKISAAPFKDHHAWLAYHYENNDLDGLTQGPEPGWEPTASYGTKNINHTVSGQWQWFPSGKTTLSAKYLAFWSDENPHLPADAPDHPGYINWWKWNDDEVWNINGAFQYVDARKSSRQTLQADYSHFAEGFLGQHDIKFGVQYTKGRGNRQEGYLQNYVNFLYPMGYDYNVDYLKNYYSADGLMFYNNRDTINPTLTVRTADSTGLFFDDQWSPTKRFTINLGLRFDRMSTKYDVGEVYDFPNSPAAMS
jgi:hypothetical protein